MIDCDELISYLICLLQAFFQGKVKIAGNIGLAMKLKELQSSAGKSKL
jgi:putative sterol carrier protein